MRQEVKDKIMQEIASAHHLSDEKASLIVNKVIKLIGRNGYTIVTNKKAQS